MQAPYIPHSKVWEFADGFRNKWSKGKYIVPIMEIAEIDLDLFIFPQPNLKQILEVDAFITSDFSMIYVDKVQFESANKARLRFSVAHEVGHYVMHKEFFRSLKITNMDSMESFLDKISEDQYTFIETQAYEFAGRLLVDPGILKEEVVAMISKLKKSGAKIDEENVDRMIAAAAVFLSRKFEVSKAVIEKRIEKEKLTEIFLS